MLARRPDGAGKEAEAEGNQEAEAAAARPRRECWTTTKRGPLGWLAAAPRARRRRRLEERGARRRGAERRSAQAAEKAAGRPGHGPPPLLLLGEGAARPERPCHARAEAMPPRRCLRPRRAGSRPRRSHRSSLDAAADGAAAGWPRWCLFCCLLGGGLAPASARGCQPCGPDCACRSFSAAACAVDCAARGLQRLPGPAFPAATVALNLSSNKISVLNVEAFAQLTSLTKLDISNNKISSLQDGIFDNLFNLSEINLSLNPFLCDCRLAWLPRWVEERRVKIVRRSETRCAQPPEVANVPLFNVSFSDVTCGADYIACLTDNNTGVADSIVRFTSTLPQNLTEETCGAFCFAGGQDYAGFSHEAHCLCGIALEPNSSLDCLPFCDVPPAGPVCGGPALIPSVFPAQLPISLVGPDAPFAPYQGVAFSVWAPIPIDTFRWDFGDHTGLLNTTKTTALHQYTSPGQYSVTVAIFVGGRLTSAQTNVTVVAAPEEIELQCPRVVKTNESLRLQIRNRGGTDLSAVYSITAQEKESRQTVQPVCPLDSVVFPGNSHCYWLVAEKAEWPEAQQHCWEYGNGTLAFVSSPQIQSFLVSRVTRSLDVWIGFNASPSPLQREEGFNLQSCQNWLPGEPHPSNADHCVRMGPAGQCNTDLCTAKHSYVCEHKPQEILLNAEHFYLGTPTFDTPVATSNATETEELSAPSGTVETVMFPGLAFQQEGYLVALELVTQELKRDVQVQFRVHRPALTEVCKEVLNTMELLPGLEENGTWADMECALGLLWCPLTNTCLPLQNCCDPETCANNSATSSPSPSPRTCENLSGRSELKESLFTLPPGPSTRYLLHFRSKDTFIRPNDTVSIQHDAGPGAFILCHPSQVPSYQMSYFTLNSSDWEPGSLMHPEAGGWHNDSTCYFRVLSVAEKTVAIIGEGNLGVDRPGLYAVRATVENGVFSANLSCDFVAVSPVSGLRVIYPPEQGGRIYVETNHTWLVVKISSGVNATAGWFAGSQSFPFGRSCPPSVIPLVPECTRDTNDTWFSVVVLENIGGNASTRVLWAENAVSSQNITITVKAEDAIRGLRATPNPETRVLLNNRVSYVPMMDAGSDVTFRWTVDDKRSFTFYNDVFHVIYQTPAVYKLSLTASNHVSNVTVDYNITVEKMNRMKDLVVSEIPPLVPQNSTVELAAMVTVDSAVDATFLWDFGDGDRVAFQFRPPYNESFLVPDPNIHQVVIGHNVSHTYQESGEYILSVLVSNEFENLTYTIPVHIYTYLMEVTLEVDADVLVADRPVTFKAVPLPSSYGVSYTWDFGDGSVASVQSLPAIVHTYSNKGMYNVSLRANNTISAVETFQSYRVFEEISGLQVVLEEAMELRTPVEITASVETGDSILWIFDMGDGTVVNSSVASVMHIYLKEMNCTVNVTATNPVNSVSQAVPVRIFVLMVLKIEPSTCIPEHPDVQLTAYVSGNPEDYLFDWTFGDGSSNVTVNGDPTVRHNFTRSGTFHLSLVLSSKVNKAHYYTEVCVEPEVTNVSLFIRPQFVRLGNESKFQVTALPPYPYRYLWDFGTNESTRFGGTEVSYTYKAPGVYLVTVTVCNNVSFNNDSVFVEVQEPVGVVRIESNGSKVLELNQVYLFSANASGTNVSYLWYFGDGMSQLGKFITHSYNKSGTYAITLTGWNNVSFREARLNVTVKRRLQGLTINASRTVVPLNGSVSFTATLLAGTAIRYSWILCDRCTPIPGYSTISYTFRSIGTFNVIVTAENEIGCLQDSIFIYVLEQIEGLHIASGDLMDDTYFPTNKTLQMQAAVREGTNISYNWTLLKENHPVQTSAGKTFSLVVLEAGVYVIHLKATNMLGSSTVNKTVEFIEQVGVLKPIASPNPAAVNISVNISTSVTAGTGLMYIWYLEDGLFLQTASSAITHSFPSPGAKAVTVVAENKFGSANATLVVYIQEPIIGVRIRTVRLNYTGYVESGSEVNFSGELERGSDVAWTWKLLNTTICGQRVALTFPSPGVFPVCLNASNDVSWDVACHSVTVEDPIQGLKLTVGKEVLEPGEEVNFVIGMASGSSVSYKMSVGGNHSMALNSSSFTYTFTQVGDYLVRVTAENHISVDYTEVLIVVLEAIHGLKVTDCCEQGMPVGIERRFTAEVDSGSRVSYLWQLSLEGDHGRSQVRVEGQSISYIPEAAGRLEIHLTAWNRLGSLNITIVIEVQDIIMQLSLLPVSSFANRTTTFEVSVLPSARQVAFWWHFGDGSPAQRTSVPSASHTYLRHGDYLVEVNASNLISFSIAQITITVQVLECEEPEAELALPGQVVMKRSQKNYLEAQLDLRGCTRYQTKYVWEIYKAPSCLQLGASDKVLLSNVDVSRPQLVIPKLALDLGTYCFKFLVSFGDTPLSKSIFANVTVTPNKLVPIIDGGSYRVWSSTRDLILDGEKSYDPNLEDWEQTPLHYQWSCMSSSKSSSAGCALNFTATGGVVTVSRSILEADVEYTFDLAVWKTGMSPEATNQTVLLKKGTVPIVSLECVSCKAQSVYEVSRSSYVYLEGTCLNCQNNSKLGRWSAHSFKNKTLALDRTTTSTGSRGMNLVLRPGALKDGEGYTFTLHITDLATGEEGFASIDLFPNQPPFGGSCWLSPMGPIQALTAKIHFECTGWRDTEDEDTPLVYTLLAARCRTGHCEEFWVYKGSHSEHSAFLPPGFQEGGSLVSVSVLVQDQLGATVVAFNSSMAITLPSPPEGFHSLPQWLSNQTEVVLQGLVKQSDPQQVIEYSLALITILNEYECSMRLKPETKHEDRLRAWTRRNITETLISLNVTTVDDIQQIAAALAQCTVANKEFVCQACLTKTLKKLRDMMAILQGETMQGTMTPTTIADNILNIMGDLIHLVNTVSQETEARETCNDQSPMQVASQAYALSTDLMRILMKSRVLNEEPLELAGSNITAKGKRAGPLGLLCYKEHPSCQFSIPLAFNATFSDLTDIVQVMIRVDYNPFPFGFVTNYTISSEVASMEFQDNNGTEIPVGSLDPEKAIAVTVLDPGEKNITMMTVMIEERSSGTAVVMVEDDNAEAGLYFQVTFSVVNGRYVSSEQEPFIAVCLFHSLETHQHNCTASKKIYLEDMTRMPQGDHRRYTFFVSPDTSNPAREYYLNITNHFAWTAVEVTLGLYSSLCQYFNEQEGHWKTEGMAPLEGATPDKAVCLTQHLTAFGASLFVPLHSVQFIRPPPGPGVNYIVLLTCAICFVTYSVAAVIVHKLDLIDINRAGVIPFCGKNGLYKYEVLVKTGWGKGSGTTAHVGITLYGMESKSGHRHLDGENAFHRNSLNIFQIATERSLGSVWKIRIWHDNKGLNPSWYLQHVIVRDLQTCKSYHFLVNDWLSVESEENDGLVEKEVFAASEADLRSFLRIFIEELQRGFFEKHVWLSLWDRPPRSRFTRVQRASCCCLLVFLFLCANAVWYGIVGDVNFSNVAISTLIPVNGETAVVGLVSSLVVYPLYLALLFLFRMARSKVSVSQSLAHSDQQSLEIDNYLDSSLMESAFLTFPGLRTEAFSEQTKTDLFLDDSKSLIRWHSNEALLNWPDLLSDPSIMGNTIQKLKRGRTSRHLGLEAPLAAEEDSLSLGFPQAQARYFSASDEDLIRQILTDGAGSLSHPQEMGPYPRVETDLISGLSSMLGEKTETIMMQRLTEKGQNVAAAAAPGRELNRSAKSTRTVTDHALRKRLLPFWCSYLAHAISLACLVICFGVSVWIGVGFTSSVALMWLISGIFSFLSSFLLWEPSKVLLEALYFSLVAKRLHPEEDDTLVEYPFVEHVSEKIGRVRPPQGFALFQAKEEAKKVKLLHGLLKNFFIYMLFLLATLLTNYGDASHNSRAFLLQSSIKQQLGSEQFLRIKRSDEFWVWMSQGLLPYLYNNQSGRGSYSVTLGSPRLRQIRLQEAECPSSIRHILSGTDPSATGGKCILGSDSFDTASYAVGWKSVAGNLTTSWTYSPPDLPGAWYWGYLSFYDSGGYVQDLGTTLEESRARLEILQRNNWISNVSRAVFVELAQYNPGLGLHAVITLRLEFPVVKHALPAVAVAALPPLPLSQGVTLQLLMMVFFMIVVVYFVVSESLSIQKAGRAYFASVGSYWQWLLILLTSGTVVVHLSQVTLANRQWAKYLRDKQGFTSFYQVASLHTAFRCLAACLLFVLTVKASQQLRFIRQWSTFGKTLQRSTKELFAAGLAFTILTLAYAQLGFLLFSHSEAFPSFPSTLQLLFTAFRSSSSLPLFLPESVGLSHLFYASYVMLELWVVLRLFAAVLMHHYRETRFEMYRPAFESQDYEMVELFVRRLKMWMGFTKAKEFRHKVRFEGMEPLPSRSSSQDSHSLQGPTPTATSDSSRASTSSSQLDGLSLAPSARDSSEVDADIQRLLSLFETLLIRFDQVNEVTNDVYHIECQLEGTRSGQARKRGGQQASRHHPIRADPGVLSSNFTPNNSSRFLPSRPRSSSTSPIKVFQAPPQGISQGALLSPQKTHASAVPVVKKKKPLRANNRVHPSGK
ncbi:polycystin-1 isoform X2 [Podarcis raffonei]|uniref:polycystin-1 isoform X2 n=1 Tax=Podarcis raffonei TaxID=65483 RepID=UPI00232966C2|nr:polycystin-1 isoform X2 [Podarcis raffonei]